MTGQNYTQKRRKKVQEQNIITDVLFLYQGLKNFSIAVPDLDLSFTKIILWSPGL